MTDLMMLDSKLVDIADSFASYSEYIEGIDAIDGHTLELIVRASQLESSAYSDFDCIEIIEKLIQNYHIWHKIDAGELE
jgi:hypothetical protein